MIRFSMILDAGTDANIAGAGIALYPCQGAIPTADLRRELQAGETDLMSPWINCGGLADAKMLGQTLFWLRGHR